MGFVFGTSVLCFKGKYKKVDMIDNECSYVIVFVLNHK